MVSQTIWNVWHLYTSSKLAKYDFSFAVDSAFVYSHSLSIWFSILIHYQNDSLHPSYSCHHLYLHLHVISNRMCFEIATATDARCAFGFANTLSRTQKHTNTIADLLRTCIQKTIIIIVVWVHLFGCTFVFVLHLPRLSKKRKMRTAMNLIWITSQCKTKHERLSCVCCCICILFFKNICNFQFKIKPKQKGSNHFIAILIYIWTLMKTIICNEIYKTPT